MSIFSDIYAGIKTVLDANLTGVHVYTDWPDNPLEYPAIVAMPFTDYQVLTVGGNGFQCNIPLEVRVFSSSQGEAMDKLYDFISPTGTDSLRAALANDATLDSKVDDSHIVPVGPMERDADNQQAANEWGYTFNLQIVKQVS